MTEEEMERAFGMVNTDNADPETVLLAIRYCAKCWTPEARIIGNIRAGDIVRAINSLDI